MLVDENTRVNTTFRDEDLTTISDADTNDTETHAGSEKGDDSLLNENSSLSHSHVTSKLPSKNSGSTNSANRKLAIPSSNANNASNISQPSTAASSVANTPSVTPAPMLPTSSPYAPTAVDAQYISNKTRNNNTSSSFPAGPGVGPTASATTSVAASTTTTTATSASTNGAPIVSGPEATVMIFDWDDTLLPTSFLARQGLRVDGMGAPPAIQAALDAYSLCVRATLNEAKRQGTVFIVTNAETGWIEVTVKKFMPLIARDVAQIRQLSARSAFEPQGVPNPFQWKEKAFQLVIEGHYSRLPPNTERHVISFGDSSHEREAALRVCAAMGPKTRCKSLKFMERPDMEHLTKEHNLIRDCLAQIVNHAGPLDLCIQCQQTSGTTTSAANTSSTTTTTTNSNGVNNTNSNSNNNNNSNLSGNQ